MASETLRYIKLDYQSHKDALLQRVRDRWPQRWNDFLANNIGIVLVDIIAWGLATTAFLVNRVAGENYISTMTLRESAVRIGGLTGYQLHGPTPATVSCEAALTATQTADVTIAKGTLIRTSDSNSVPFEVAADYTIFAGDLTPRKLVATFSPILSGSNVINTFLAVTNGSSIVDAVDTTIDLSAYIEAGQSLNQLSESEIYTIESLSAAPGSVSQFSEILLDRPWAGATATIAAQVFDQRIALIQGQTVTDRFVAPVSTVSYAVKLSQSAVIDNSVQVLVNGEPWSQVSSIGVQDGFASVYQVKTFVSGDVSVLFGDGAFGALVPSEASIAVNYRIGGGSSGNVDLNTINTTITGLIETLSSPVPILITNTSSTGIGGQEPETLDQARVNIPFYTRTNDRAVTLSDYQTIAQQFNSAQFGAVAYARSTVRTENALLEGNIVSVYAWTTGPSGGLVSLNGQLKSALKDFLQTKAVGTDFVQILDGTARPVPISLRFKVLHGFSVAETKNLILAAIDANITALRPGDPVIYSDLVSLLDGTFGVDNLVFATPTTDLFPSNTTELFTVPQDSFIYTLAKTSAGVPVTDSSGANVSKYNVQFPMFPLQAWSFTLSLGVNQLSIMPFLAQDASGRVQVQQARLLGQNLSIDDDYPSTINLLTGQATLYIQGAPGDLTMQLNTAQGYSSDRIVNVYIGYQGDITQTKRREIRAALQSWGQGFGIGSSIYAQRVEGVSASVISVTDMVEAIPGVDSVTRVALDTPANTAVRITAADFEILRVGNIILNNQVDVLLALAVPAAIIFGCLGSMFMC
jgi:hypothetical protein